MRDLAAINAGLLDRLDDLVHVLALPQPMVRRGGQLRFGRRGSLVIHTGGPRAGSWHSFESGAGGDLIALVAAFRGGRQGDAIAWAADWLGSAFAAQEQPRSPPRPRPAPPKRAPVAQDIWRRRRDPGGSPVEAYLAGRGLALPKPAAWLGYVPDLEYWQDGRRIGCLPAMVAAIAGANGLLGVHCTYLQQGEHGWRKAALPAPKKVQGTWGGGAIRISTAPADVLALAEGIETALAYRQATNLDVWAVVCVDNFRRQALPPQVRTVVLAGDGDEPELVAVIAAGGTPRTPSGRALARAAGRFRAEGRRVRLSIPRDAAGRKLDWNDVLLQGSAA